MPGQPVVETGPLSQSVREDVDGNFLLAVTDNDGQALATEAGRRNVADQTLQELRWIRIGLGLALNIDLTQF